ncbi:predicted protein [Plenodomus lingam JN3]|uniref:Predicted protein n=1 Tax=Leptosphaeria maculans (strain JN3 / isolate v23.1.3 / race Av1-4-5-6-7-8) TaxID=985895 RepID=E4ZZF3_LEPMJ|nr:predicted protein [Plenodomus lingam JN3]CBX96748.1 predicted protein [Plenodomus lingam JN3]
MSLQDTYGIPQLHASGFGKAPAGQFVSVGTTVFSTSPKWHDTESPEFIFSRKTCKTFNDMIINWTVIYQQLLLTESQIIAEISEGLPRLTAHRRNEETADPNPNTQSQDEPKCVNGLAASTTFTGPRNFIKKHRLTRWMLRNNGGQPPNEGEELKDFFAPADPHPPPQHMEPPAAEIPPPMPNVEDNGAQFAAPMIVMNFFDTPTKRSLTKTIFGRDPTFQAEWVGQATHRTAGV